MLQAISRRVAVGRMLHRLLLVGSVLLVAAPLVRSAQAQSTANAGEERLARPRLLAMPHAPAAAVSPAAPQRALPLQEPPRPAGASPNQSSTPTVAPISFLAAPFASDGAPDVYGAYEAYLSLTGDFAHTGHLDTVVLQGDGTMNYMVNDGKGNFTKKYVVVNPTFVDVNDGRVADLNGDGYLDIVVACASPVGFLVFMNNGDGTFAPAKFTALPAQTGPGFRLSGTYLNVADVNNDGKMDIVASAYMYGLSGNTQAGTVYNMYFAGNGNGTFQTPVVGATAYVGSDVGLRGTILADMNGDGKLDAVGAIWVENATTGQYTAYLSVGLGDGAGHFAKYGNPTATNAIADSFHANVTMQALDLNSDGKLDILWAPATAFTYTSLGNGDGTLQDPNTAITAVNDIGSFTTGDFNRDGYPDIAVFIDGLLSVYLGLGNGSFSVYPVSQYANEIAGSQPPFAQDFDGDGLPDLLIASPGRNQLSFLKGSGDGTFRTAPVVVPQNAGSNPPNNTENAAFINVDAIGNWFGDGKLNLLSEEVSGGQDYLDYATQNGANGFNFTRIFNLSQIDNITAIEPIAGDFNNDGKADFILALTNGIGIGLSNGDGTITRTLATFAFNLSCSLSYVAVGDVNNDGKQDIVAAYAGDTSCFGSGTVASGFFVLLGDGTGHFTTTYTAFGGELYIPRLADLNGDGKLDLVLDDISAIPAIYVIPGDGSGNFKAANARTILKGGGTQNSFLMDDFNGDGIPDLTVLQSGIAGATDIRQKGIFTMAGNGDFTFQPPQFLYRGLTGVEEVYADFNRDGLPDLVVNLGVGSISFGGVAVYPNLGNGTFGAPVMLQSPVVSTGEANNLLAAGDFNGDGAPDILLGAGEGYVPNVLFPNAAGNQLVLVAESANTTQYNPLSLSAATFAIGGQQPTGAVSFYSNGGLLGTVPLVGGISNLSTTALAVGTDTITAKYAGDALNYPSTSNSALVTVTALAPSFAMTGSTSQLTVTGAVPGQLTLTLQANQSFQGSVSFACQGLPASVVCTFQPTPATLSASGSATVNAVLTYNAQLAGLHALPRGNGPALAGFALVLLLLPVRRRKRLRLGLPVALLGCILLAGLSGCSSAGGMTPFTANFNIVATGLSGSTSVERSTPLSVSVQP